MTSDLLYATHVRVDRAAIVSNVQGARRRVQEDRPDRKVLVAVKANAYGHGAVAVSRALEESGAADWLGVATVPEGVELVEAGISLPVLKFSPALPEELPAAVTAGLVLSVASEANVRDIAAVAERLERVATVHLKVDTGMGRVGVAPEEAPALAALVEALPGVELGGIFTHLPVSDSADGVEFTATQVRRFAEVVAEVTEAVGRHPGIVHAANSGGVLGHPDSWFDMVRPGIMAYGYYPDATTPHTVDLTPAMTFATRVSFVKDVEPGESVGYGRTWVAPRRTRIATIPAGYADGLNRLLSNQGHVVVGGERRPIVGRVCMDQTMVDLGPDSEVQVGDEVLLMGRDGTTGAEVTCDEVAQLCGTITYEVTCQVSPRVTRVQM